ncbi:peptidase M24, structural domain-containing protein [Cladochytrium replicatum]|nr:peptidase M24, structural domain-containing protein [Cladochytrium replicatum]
MDQKEPLLTSTAIPATPKPRCKRARLFIAIVSAFLLIFAAHSFHAHSACLHDGALGVDHPAFATLRDMAAAAPPPISVDEHLDRQLRLGQQLASFGLDAFITEPGTETTTYLVGPKLAWGLSERPFLVVVLPVQPGAQSANTYVVVPAFEIDRAKEVLSDIAVDDVTRFRVWQENESPYEIAANLIREVSGRSSVTVGIESYVRAFILSGFQRVPSVTAVSGNDAIRSLRIHKSEAEIALLRYANKATKASIARASLFARVGTTEQGLTTSVRNALAAAGLKNLWVVVLFGPNAAYPHGTRGVAPKLTKEGSVILVDAGGEYEGYQADITRTWWYNGGNKQNRAPEEIQRAWGAVRQAQLAAIKAAETIGSSCEDVDLAARAAVTSNGFGEGYATFKHRLGHGIGLGVHEEPYFTRGNSETIVSAGVSFSVEPGIYVSGRYGVRLEDIAVVHERIDPATGETLREVEVFGALSETLDDPFKGHF